MTRLSHYLLPTERAAPADAEAASHKLLVRAGMVRQVGSGLWSYLPAGWRVQQRIQQIIRTEMNAIGGQEIQMPLLSPAEPWRKTGRLGIHEVFKLRDRKDAELVLSMTHEETVTTHIAQLVKSYRDLPQILYQVQLKERDEPRPRAGILRTREFTMKDSYSIDCDAAGMEASYERHITAYNRIFDRSGLEWYQVASDVGMMGGKIAHEYMAPCAAGEDQIVLAPGYAANIEVAQTTPPRVELPPAGSHAAPAEVHTPGANTIEQLATLLELPPAALLKAYPVVAEQQGFVLVLLRGDDRLNETKLRNYFGVSFRQASTDEITAELGPPGYLGPVGRDVKVVLDASVETAGAYVVGANRVDYHFQGVQPGRDFQFESADLRLARAGDTVNGQAITIQPAIEVANIFQLGTRYSEPLGAKYLDEHGQEQLVWMASYGIGPARIAAAAVEQRHDSNGIVWPKAIAPFDVHLVVVGKADTPQQPVAEQLYQDLQSLGLEVVFDDRDVGPGQKFVDAELLGCPLRVTVGKRSLESGCFEVQIRDGQESTSVATDGGGKAIKTLWESL